MSRADLPHADVLREIAGWNQRLADWERFLNSSPHGSFVAETNDTVAGTITTIQYEKQVGWIGMLLVHPDARGQGIGKTLLLRAIDHLQNDGVPCIKLDATPLGEPLYRKLGFKPEWKLTRFKGETRDLLDRTVRRMLKLNETNFRDAINLDSQAFGAPRTRLLQSLIASAPIALGHSTKKSLNGFGLLRAGSVADYIGPVVANGQHIAAEIIVELLETRFLRERPFYWDVPHPNKPALALAEKLGLTPERELLRMYLGSNDSAGDPSKYFAIADPSLG